MYFNIVSGFWILASPVVRCKCQCPIQILKMWHATPGYPASNCPTPGPSASHLTPARKVSHINKRKSSKYWDSSLEILWYPNVLVGLWFTYCVVPKPSKTVLYSADQHLPAIYTVAHFIMNKFLYFIQEAFTFVCPPLGNGPWTFFIVASKKRPRCLLIGVFAMGAANFPHAKVSTAMFPVLRAK
jgi:hypothetical protein